MSPDTINADYVIGAEKSRFVYRVEVKRQDSAAAFAYTVQPDISPWLSVDSPSGSTPGSFQVAIDASWMSPGTYSADIAISDTEGNRVATVPVGLRVRERPTVVARPTSLAFSHQIGAPTPAAQTINLTGGKTQFSATARTDTGVNWLHVALGRADSSVTASSLAISVEPGSLQPGTYTGYVVIRAPDASNQDLTIPVVMTITPGPNVVFTPAALFLEAQAGASQSPAATVTVNTNGELLQVAPMTSSTPWLSAGPSVVSVGLCDSDLRGIVPRSAVIGVKADASALVPGVYKSAVRLSVANRPQAIDIPVTLTVHSADMIVPQVADGGEWKTSIVLANADREPAPFTIRFVGADGGPLALPVEGEGVVSELSGIIPVAGARTIDTIGEAADLKQGWAKVTAGKAVTGTAIFRQRTNDGDSEAGVSVASPVKGAISLPFDNTGGFVTAAALVNPTTASAALRAVVRDENGQTLSTDTVFLGPESRTAFAIPDRFAATANRRGVVTFATSHGDDVAGFGLRFNPRHSFTAIQALPPAPAKTEPVSRSVAQVADGGNWKTTIILVNNSQTTQPFSIVFRNEYGGPLPMPLVGPGAVTEYADTIPAGGLRVVESEGAAAHTVQGSAEIVSGHPVMGTVIFRQRSSTGLDSEGAVQVGPGAGDRVLVPFDNTRGFVTALAVMNESASGNTIAVTVRDNDGAAITAGLIQLGAQERRAVALAAAFPAAKDRKGTLELSGSTFSVLALRFNPRGAFTSVATAAK